LTAWWRSNAKAGPGAFAEASKQAPSKQAPTPNRIAISSSFS
jgi:hypothetical protein